jgi:hypothetical protein
MKDGARNGDAGVATLGVLPSSVRKRLKTRQLRFPADPSVCKSIKRNGLACCGELGQEVGQVNMQTLY